MIGWPELRFAGPRQIASRRSVAVENCDNHFVGVCAAETVIDLQLEHQRGSAGADRRGRERRRRTGSVGKRYRWPAELRPRVRQGIAVRIAAGGSVERHQRFLVAGLIQTGIGDRVVVEVIDSDADRIR